MDSLLQILDRANAAAPEYSIQGLVLSLLLAFVLGQAIAWVYAWTHSGLSYSRSFTQSLVLITMLVSLVMSVIGNSIISAFGLLGALAIIRFRNVLKDTRDTVAIFLSLILGMACGTQRYLEAVAGTFTMLAVMVFFWWTNFGSFGRYDGYITLRCDPARGGPERLNGVFRSYCRSTKQMSLHVGMSDSEYVFQIAMRDRQKAQALVSALRQMDGVTEASLVLRDELTEV
jgi:uncharacterized membrane protein YhiD involved in acid resistance